MNQKRNEILKRKISRKALNPISMGDNVRISQYSSSANSDQHKITSSFEEPLYTSDIAKKRSCLSSTLPFVFRYESFDTEASSFELNSKHKKSNRGSHFSYVCYNDKNYHKREAEFTF